MAIRLLGSGVGCCGYKVVSKVVAIRLLGSGVGRGRKQVAREAGGEAAGKWENKLGIRQQPPTVTHIQESFSNKEEKKMKS